MQNIPEPLTIFTIQQPHSIRSCSWFCSCCSVVATYLRSVAGITCCTWILQLFILTVQQYVHVWSLYCFWLFVTCISSVTFCQNLDSSEFTILGLPKFCLIFYRPCNALWDLFKRCFCPRGKNHWSLNWRTLSSGVFYSACLSLLCCGNIDIKVSNKK